MFSLIFLNLLLSAIALIEICRNQIRSYVRTTGSNLSSANEEEFTYLVPSDNYAQSLVDW